MEMLRSNAAHAAAPASPPESELTLARVIVDNLIRRQAHSPEGASMHDWYMAVAYTVRDRLVERWLRTAREVSRDDVRVVAYMSAEFLTGSHLENHLINLDLLEPMRQAVDLARTSTSTCSPPRRRSPAWATAASGGSPRASWTRCRRCRSPRSATASATSTASSTS